MSPRSSSSDGLSQLTEMMRSDRIVEPARTSPPVDPRARRRRRRGGLIVGAVVTVTALALGIGYVTWALDAPIGPASATTALPDVAPPAAAALALSPEGASAISVVGADDYLGATASGIWAANGGDEPRPIASITKLITTMVVLSAKPLAVGEAGPTLTFDKADHALYDKYYVLGATIAEMPTGSTMSEADALKMLLVPSASNYAEAVAQWAFGSTGAYVSAARQWLAAQGLTGTTIVEPTGIDPRNVSTTTDMITLGKLAMADPLIAQIVGMPSVQVPGIPSQTNTNYLLGTAGITGIKTGTLEGIGSNLLFSAQLPVQDGVTATVTGVVLGAYSGESMGLDVTTMLASVAAGFHDVPVASAGAKVGTYTTPWGESAEMVLGQSASIFTWSDTPITTELETTTLTTGAEGQTVGSVTWSAGPNTVTVPLKLAGAITPPTAWWRLTHPEELG